MKNKIEILSPAGSYESMKAAVAAGADAVYIGGIRFGARAFADNLSEDKLMEAIDYVHLHGRKIYLTINTLLKEDELKNELYDYLLPYYRQGIDAVIVQDLGVLSFVKEQFPDLPIHASTQMTITDLSGAVFLEKHGVERIVTSREMSLNEIREITENTNLEVESFVHGALCYCYSGQCLYSSLIGGRSGNRGQCAQPCRLPYRVNGEKESQYVLSLKDICTLEYIPELIESGIYSFKIEGRMKKPEYVALVTAMYRKYTDLYLEKGKEGFHVDPKDKEKLMDLYNRGGFHGGYYYTRNGREMVSLKRPNHAGVPALQVLKYNERNVTAKALVDIRKGDIVELPDQKENYTFANDVKKGQSISFTTHKKQTFEKNAVLCRTRNESLLREINETIINSKKKRKINGKLTLSLTDSARLILSCDETMVEVCEDIVQEAVNQPMDAARIEKQMRKTGNTEFEFEHLEIEMQGGVFVPMQRLNELRRMGIEILEQKILASYRRREPDRKPYLCNKIGDADTVEGFHVYVEELEQLQEVVEFESVKRIYLDANAVGQIWKSREVGDIVESVHQFKKKIYLAFPHIFRRNTRTVYEGYYDAILKQGWDGFLIRNNESYEFLMQQGYQGDVVTDYNMYLFNQYAKAFWKEKSVGSFTAPLELNYKELRQVGLENSELVVYGYLPMMVSAQCVMKTTHGCKKQKDRLILKDRYQKEFTVRNCCDYCYNVIYNTAPLLLIDQKEEILNMGPKALRLHFTIEDKRKVKEILSLYEDVFLKNQSNAEVDMEFTRGHFKRGVK